jgi:hypothetical protein
MILFAYITKFIPISNSNSFGLIFGRCKENNLYPVGKRVLYICIRKNIVDSFILKTFSMLQVKTHCSKNLISLSSESKEISEEVTQISASRIV